jgi:hypothetical protein
LGTFTISANHNKAWNIFVVRFVNSSIVIFFEKKNYRAGKEFVIEDYTSGGGCDPCRTVGNWLWLSGKGRAA